eukprot:TRINITY_DN7885_c0_g1_i1.p1 TRINITY_DN7885_c0_g1~~TRINITY_DN7885_c0_g1_i1.p1  ORF type:complete len:486 (-),score=129.46 TRINITY_DN7885_c0_g1_i1:473-1795(-)
MEPPKSTRKRNKIVIDEESTVIKGPVMRLHLLQTDDIKRTRKRAPHAPEELRALKMKALGVDPFTVPSVYGLAPQLVTFFRTIIVEAPAAFPRKRGERSEPLAPTPADKAPRMEDTAPGMNEDGNAGREEQQQEMEDEKVEEMVEEGARKSPMDAETRGEMAGEHDVEDVELLRGEPQAPGSAERSAEGTFSAVEVEGRPSGDAGATKEDSSLQYVAAENGLTPLPNGADEPYRGGHAEEEQLPETPFSKPADVVEFEALETADEGEMGTARETETEEAAPGGNDDVPLTAGTDSALPVPKETPARGDAAQKFADGLDFLSERGNAQDGGEAEDDDDDNEEEGQHGKAKIDDGWSARTRAVGKYLKGAFEGMGADTTTKESQMPELGISQMLHGKSKREAARLYFEVLLLKTRDYVHVEQSKPYGEITIAGKRALMASNL